MSLSRDDAVLLALGAYGMLLSTHAAYAVAVFFRTIRRYFKR